MMKDFLPRLYWLSLSLVMVSSVACCDPASSDPEPNPIRTELYNPEWSAARNWNEALLAAIREDLARPPVHARNLFHSSALMYDLWAVYDSRADLYFLGRPEEGCSFSEADRNQLTASTHTPELHRTRAISHAMFRFLSHRFARSAGNDTQLPLFRQLLEDMGYNPDFESRNYHSGTSQHRAAALGLYIADCVIALGLNDGANEAEDYINAHYTPVNEPLEPDKPGTPGMIDPNRWQPLELLMAIDQSGNPVDNQPAFIGAEWGHVTPFALPAEARETYSRDGHTWPVYHDPGPPAYLTGDPEVPDDYAWNHSVVLYWSSHLDPSDGVIWDISPGSIGNTEALPQTPETLRTFFDALDGGTNDTGHPLNPATGEPYAPNLVPRGDYTRILAEFWADGPDSETPPGHWYAIANQAVSDHLGESKRYRGEGETLSDLEWDVKLYFALGAAMHDAAIAAWGIKGWYDYVRPISALRYMASLGQRSDDTLPNYHPEGLPLLEGYVAIVDEDDPLVGDDQEHLGKIKVYAWRGPDFIRSPIIDAAGVGWILAENWWPYQRPTFVSPPFAGYVSGHSTFSRAAAEILTEFTGDAFFPGGLGEFIAPQDDFLVFERGPSQDIVLQWATYRDASDQTSLSRIWGGIHPPVDDIPGRRLGIAVAADVMAQAHQYFEGVATRTE